jgi:hypothetical protein
MSERAITNRDMDILGMQVDGFDDVVVELSRIVDGPVGKERQTYKSACLPVEAVRAYLGALYGPEA